MRSATITLSALFCLAATAVAQNSGSITGTVWDATGAVVPGGQVIVSDSQKGISLKTTTNSDGGYLVAGLPHWQLRFVHHREGFPEV
jgi:hypothetical protein